MSCNNKKYSDSLKGRDGRDGIQGNDGPMGPKGERGYIGSNGGDKGSKGDKGCKGTIGCKGNSGNRGEIGQTGISGINGINGTPGAQGIQGVPGFLGIQGTQGVKGSSGINGIQGVQGVHGLQGLQGANGERGLRGFIGSIGSKGDTGIQGVKGEQGTSGEKGIKGGTGSLGIQGTQGIQGITGSSHGQLIGLTNIWSNDWHYSFRLNTTMRPVKLTNYKPTTGNYQDNDPINNPDALTFGNTKDTFYSITFVVPTSKKVLIEFRFPWHAFGTHSNWNIETTLADTTSVPYTAIRDTDGLKTSSGNDSDFYSCHNISTKTSTNFLNEISRQFYIDTSLLKTPRNTGDSLTLYLCASGTESRIGTGMQNHFGNYGGVCYGTLIAKAWSLDGITITEPSL